MEEPKNSKVDIKDQFFNIDLLSGAEKNKYLYEFNDTACDYPKDKTIIELFQKQVIENPDNIAYQSDSFSVTYKELDEKSNQFALFITDKYNVKQGDIVGILLDREEYLIPVILGILKIGGAYLPIDTIYPLDRIIDIVEDSQMKLLVSRGVQSVTEKVQCSYVDLNQSEKDIEDQSGAFVIQQPDSDNLAYVIYTSGSTGKPKGVMIRHYNLINYIFWAIRQYAENGKIIMPLYSSISFDLTITSIFVPLLSGNKIVLYKENDDVLPIEKVIQDNLCDTIKLTPSHLTILKDSEILRENILSGTNIKSFIVGGENFPSALAKSIHDLFGGNIKIYNEYGPTEVTVGCMIYTFNPEDGSSSVPVGVPISNTQIYLLDEFLKPVPKGVLGELYLSGDSLGLGYLNNEILTNNAFVSNPFIEGKKMYKTGDFAKRNNDGNLVYAGRKDEQVKINSFRIELGDIEAKVLQHENIIECIATVYEKNDDKHLTVYYRSDNTIEPSEIKSFLSGRLPKYMIPAFFVRVETMPLTSNGKIDKKKLPDPIMNADESYVKPTTLTEEKLLEVWAEVLNTDHDKISTTADFMDMGGHSIKIMHMLNKVFREFNVKISIHTAFDYLTIKKLAAYIDTLKKDNVFVAIKQADHKDHYSLSSLQNRMYFLHEFNPDLLIYNLPKVLKIKGKVDMDRMQSAISLLIQRHESLRTSFHLVNQSPVQKITDEVDYKIERFRSYESDAKDIVNNFIRTFDLSVAPLTRAGIIEMENDEYILIFDQHHIITDGVSESILIKEFLSLYAGEELLPVKLQYRDYVEWQYSEAQQQELSRQKDFWISEFKNEISTLDLPSDYPRPLINAQEGAAVEFEINGAVTSDLRQLAKKEGATLYMVMLSVFNILLSKLSNEEDIVVGTPVAGRQHVDLENVIGAFVNVLPVRNFPESKLKFNEFLQNTKSKTLGVFNNQDYPYEQLIDDLEVVRDTSHNALFDVMFAYQNFDNVQFEIPGLQITGYPLETKVSRLDLSLQIFENGDKLQLQFEYSTLLFKKETVDRFISYFNKIISSILENKYIRLADIEIISQDEKNMLLEKFNATSGDYPKNATIVSLFEQQVQKSPEKVAIVYEGTALTYHELNNKANQLAHLLKNKYNVKTGDVVGVIAERSEKLIFALLGILKSGAAYLPIDPAYPKERTSFILEESNADIVIVDISENVQFEGTVIKFNDAENEEISNLVSAPQSDDLCYMIYTSGSTGMPKGVKISHQNVVNFMYGMNQNLTATENDCMLAVTSTSFDISVLEIFWTLCNGIEVVLHPGDIALTGLDRYLVDEDQSVDFSLFFFSSYNNRENNKYDLLLESVKYADQAGFNAVWTPERHFHEFGGLYPNPSVMSSALAMITKQIELRSGSIVSPLHDPIRIVEEWSVVDNLSNGRVGLSFASGWNANDFTLNPGLFSDRHSIMYSQIDVMKKLWRGEPVKRKNGLGEEIDVKVYPRPVQEEMPVWITSSGNEETFRSAGEIGANLLTHLLGQSIEQLKDKIQIYKDARELNGHGRNSGKIAIMLHAFIGEDIDEVERIVEEPFTEYLKSSVGINRILMEEAGLSVEDMDGDMMKVLLKNAFKRYYNTSSLIGTKNKCREMVLQLKEIGVDEIACLIDFGVEKDKVLESLEYIKDLKQLFNNQSHKNHRPITMMQSTPSFIKMSVESTGSANFLKSLNTLLLGGEGLPYSLLETLRENTSANIYNMYGPTETTIWSAMHKISNEDTVVSIGKPILNTQILILDKDMKLVPVGVKGHLFIGGDGVSKGYWKRESLTGERFVDNPYNPRNKIYNTGDIAKFNEDGTIKLIGREDNQVKIRGHRIELGDIESCLNSHTDIKQSVVIVNGEYENKSLAAYYVSDKNIDSTLLRDKLLESLPAYMLPAYFIKLESLPLTPNGKIDRKKLPNPATVIQDSYVAPSNDTEEILVSIWSEVLELNKELISVNKSFFELGGNSLKILKLNALMNERLNWNVSIPEIFRYPSIASLIDHKTNSNNSTEEYKAAADIEISEMQDMFNILEH
ncbi:amino acid adenylation domain-containing protein/natural product biosynthesis luciferase-like monooxygenase domain-containing protein [Chryseobacterium taeanense]|uniref:Amino acid adenylation domain-containing protein/natural product biosynthesis luciferase-like monooxygenase domain-containing protein n=1 Tax=Chryseobacterium taeanense TaxID=311334 RepID=A0A1G8J375_9FLAO|nr:non-ribosomal peptide synthetase [Chryseobacterium taeanense]SDI25417.1 amino acid adenylation domain-containing protein/natural product biosynthesis luciferase-like monooxygenase domain-containing protein [Chryseobacterium taeanense]